MTKKKFAIEATKIILKYMLKYAFIGASILFFVWIGISIINVDMHNMMPGDSSGIWTWNFFNLFP